MTPQERVARHATMVPHLRHSAGQRQTVRATRTALSQFAAPAHADMTEHEVRHGSAAALNAAEESAFDLGDCGGLGARRAIRLLHSSTRPVC
jgi:hypothetical protein